MTKQIRISLDDPEVRAVWHTVLEAREEVASWPAWKRGERVAAAEGNEPELSTRSDSTKKYTGARFVPRRASESR